MTSNKEKGDKFRDRVWEYFIEENVSLKSEYKVEIGFGNRKKEHPFDLGNELILVECKNYSWTAGGNIPSAKLSTLNETMLYFDATDPKYTKRVFIAKTAENKNSKTLAEYYIEKYRHLIPVGIEIWELDDARMTAELKFGKKLE